MTGFTKEELSIFLENSFASAGQFFSIEEVTEDGIIILYKVNERSLRPGGTVSGPAIMLIADCALYLAILGQQKNAMTAVTSNLSFNFFRKSPGDQNIRAVCKILKFGKKLATGEVLMYTEQSNDLVAQAVGTFAL